MMARLRKEWAAFYQTRETSLVKFEHAHIQQMDRLDHFVMDLTERLQERQAALEANHVEQQKDLEAEFARRMPQG